MHDLKRSYSETSHLRLCNVPIAWFEHLYNVLLASELDYTFSLQNVNVGIFGDYGVKF